MICVINRQRIHQLAWMSNAYQFKLYSIYTINNLAEKLGISKEIQAEPFPWKWSNFQRKIVFNVTNDDFLSKLDRFVDFSGKIEKRPKLDENTPQTAVVVSTGYDLGSGYNRSF